MTRGEAKVTPHGIADSMGSVLFLALGFSMYLFGISLA